MVSLVSDRSHPLVARVMEEAEGFRRADYLEGHTDGAAHSVYQTKWLKFGLKRLGLPDAWRLPASFDPYAAVFWLDYLEIPIGGPPFSESVKEAAPYLAWAEAHFHGWGPPAPVPARSYPLSWGRHPDREPPFGMGLIAPDFVDRRVSAPDARHAAEMLLYFLDRAQRGSRAPDEQVEHAY
jgi:hypothetical protein